jgi:outer membrane lipoprotein-sorting protein
MRIALLIFLFLLAVHAAFAKESKSVLAPVKISKKDLTEDKDLIEVAKKLQSSPLVKMQLKKTVLNVVMDEETTQEGNLAVTRGKLRMNIVGDEHSSVIVNKKEIWIVNYDTEDKEKAKQVVHVKSGKEKVHQLLLSLLDGEQLLENFEIKKSVRKDNILMFELQPKSKIDEIVKVQLAADDKDFVVKTIQYWDASDNKTKFDFSDVQFLKKGEPKLFAFSPPKGVKVEEL